MVTIEHLSVDYYRRGTIIHAVRDFSLSLRPGETVGLVGESGSGKSTVALAILRLIRRQEGAITAGRIEFHGNDLLSSSEEAIRAIRGKRISMIFQDPFTSLNPVMRIRDQMRESGTGLADALSRVQLDPDRVLNAYPHQLSGGQRQRVSIATALLNKPEFLLADEPTTALDVLVQKEILLTLFKLQKEMNLGLLFISHHLALVAQYAQRIAVMKEGQLVELGSALDVMQKPQHAYTRQLVESMRKLYNSAMRSS